ncbi:MAG: outer membrane beta-barrel protein [Gammaproteobacteria bacterium]|nr:outer membrane beta-barrel protein [Gammaproteobacteria bacterium]
MRLKRYSLICLGLMACAPLWASQDQNAVYIGVDGGWSLPSQSPSLAHYSSGNQSLTYGGTLGYQMVVGKNLATSVETNYSQFGQANYSGNASAGNGSGSFKNSAIQVLLTGTYLMGDGFNTFLKVGAAHEQSSLDLANNTMGVAGWIPAVAAGLGYELVKNFDLYAQYERTFGDNWENASTSTGGGPDHPVSLNVLTMGVNYTLPI